MRVLSVYCQPGGSCEACGQTITWHYVMELDTGGTTVLGWVCALRLLGITGKPQEQTLKRYAGAAAREWRRGSPPPQPGEVRAAYINRRITEKMNARAAWQAWQGVRHRMEDEVTQRLAARGVHAPPPRELHQPMGTDGHDATREDACRKCTDAWRAYTRYLRARQEERARILEDIERQYGAHRADFLHVPVRYL